MCSHIEREFHLMQQVVSRKRHHLEVSSAQTSSLTSRATQALEIHSRQPVRGSYISRSIWTLVNRSAASPREPTTEEGTSAGGAIGRVTLIPFSRRYIFEDSYTIRGSAFILLEYYVEDAFILLVPASLGRPMLEKTFPFEGLPHLEDVRAISGVPRRRTHLHSTTLDARFGSDNFIQVKTPWSDI